MTDEELNIAICKARGWRVVPFDCGGIPSEHLIGPDGVCWATNGAGVGFHNDQLPDHIEGVQALGHMHEAEKELTNQERQHYATALTGIAEEQECSVGWDVIHIPTKHRAIAWARVKGIYH